MRLLIIVFLAMTPQLFTAAPSLSQEQASPATPSAQAPPGKSGAESKQKDDLKDFDEVVKDTEKFEGLFTLYRTKKGVVYLEIKPEQLDTDFILLATLESGIGEKGILSGMPMQDWLVTFRHVNERIQFVQRNPYFRAKASDPIHRAVERSFSDSILGSFAVESIHKDRKSYLVNLGSVFLNDVSDLANMLNPSMGTNFTLDREKTRFSATKMFPLNMELEAEYVFNAQKGASSEVLPDSRSLRLRVHYSISRAPESTSFRPRLADDRVGYFLTVFKDYSDDTRQTAFVRYINRWNVKAGPDARATKPIVFWLDNATPKEYRNAIRDGVLYWNKAYEKIGIKDAIQVNQMPDDAPWDPADVRYNVIRWITSSSPAFGAMGPSRVNPMTGEILDADILIEAETVRGIKRYYRRWISELGARGSAESALPIKSVDPSRLCTYGVHKSMEAAFGGIALFLYGELGDDGELPSDFVDAFLRDLTAHEVGHTLGLRHNFHASTMLTPRELFDQPITRMRGIAGSVMDYLPVNLAPRGVKQGDFFMPTIGPYDEWAIEYGYRPIEADAIEGELTTLRLIASRAPLRELAYATDEDTNDFGGEARSIDPESQRFDMSSDPIAWAKMRVHIVRDLLPRLNQRVPLQGQSYTEARDVFDSLFAAYRGAVGAVTKYIGGVYFRRTHAGDSGGGLPFRPVPAAKQREALVFLRDNVFNENALRIPPRLLYKLAPERYWHWGFDPSTLRRFDYPFLDQLLSLQTDTLNRIFQPIILDRLRDAEVRASNPQDFLPITELFGTVRESIWSELNPLKGKTVAIGNARRQLQREHLSMLIKMLVRPAPRAPEDGRTLSWNDLQILRAKIAARLKTNSLTDTMTKAHLSESLARIQKALDARLQMEVRG